MQAEELLIGERASSVTLNLLRPAAGAASTSVPLTEYSVVLRRVASSPSSAFRERANGEAHEACTVAGEQGRAVESAELQAPSPGVTGGHMQGGKGGVVRYEAVLEAQAASCLYASYPVHNPIAASMPGARGRDHAAHLLAAACEEDEDDEDDEDLVSILEHVVARLRSATHRGGSGGGVASRRAIRRQDDDERKECDRQQGAADDKGATGRHGKVQRTAQTKGAAKIAGKRNASMERHAGISGISGILRRKPAVRAVRAVRGPLRTAVQKVFGEGKRGDVAVPRGIPCLIIDKPCWR